MKSSQILRQARELLIADTAGYVCTAIAHVRDTLVAQITSPVKCSITRLKAMDLILEVRRRIHPHILVNTWIQHNVKLPVEEITDERLKQYRIDWVTSLIEEYESIGD